MHEGPTIGLDVTQAVKRRGRGIARYIRQVVAARPAGALSAELYIRDHRWLKRALIDDLAPELPRRWLASPLGLRAPRPDLLHGFGNHLPQREKIPLSFTVHDVRALDQPAGYEGKARLERNIHRANGIICLTEYGKTRLAHHFPRLQDKVVHVIPHGVDHDLFYPRPEEEVASISQRYGLQRPYLVQLGSWFPHKNLELSVRSWRQSKAAEEGLDLVFIGGAAPEAYRQELLTLAGPLRERMHWIEHAPAPDLPALLSGARCLLQPSRYEGFALPLLEAMAVGLPGVVSNASCLPEVSAGLWPVADVEDVDAFSQGLDRMALNDAARSDVSRKGLAYARNFTWERTAGANEAFFSAVLQARG